MSLITVFFSAKSEAGACPKAESEMFLIRNSSNSSKMRLAGLAGLQRKEVIYARVAREV